jgi:hydroxymethylglutaryl-CoA reductase (NADPH)
MFPPYMLEKIFIKGSLKNTEKGFEFSLKNVVDSGTLVEFGPVTVDGKAYQAAALTVITGSQERGFQERSCDQITRLAPFAVYVGSTFTIRVNGEALAAGEHAINISALTREIGRISFEVKDTVV